MQAQIKVEGSLNADDTLSMTSSVSLDGSRDVVPMLSRELYRLKEATLREALVKLGWTPPPNKDGESS